MSTDLVLAVLHSGQVGARCDRPLSSPVLAFAKGAGSFFSRNLMGRGNRASGGERKTGYKPFLLTSAILCVASPPPALLCVFTFQTQTVELMCLLFLLCLL